MIARPLALLWWFVVALSASVARGDEGPRVLMIVDADTRDVEPRLHAELLALGFEVLSERAPSADTSRAALEDAARKAGAVAALRVRSSPGGVEVWITDRVTGKTVLREVVLPSFDNEAGDRSALVTLRVVELLRASLLEIESSLPPRGEVPPPPEVRAVVTPLRRTPPPSPARLRLQLSPAMGLSPGGFRPSAQIGLDLGWLALDRLDLGLSLMAPIFPSRIHDAEGSASPLFALAGIGADFVALPPGAALNAEFGGGIALLWMHIEGSAVAPYVGRSDDLFAAVPYVRARGSYGFTRRLRAVLDGRLGIAVPQPVIHFAGREVARWGRPAAMLGLGLEIGLDGR